MGFNPHLLTNPNLCQPVDNIPRLSSCRSSVCVCVCVYVCVSVSVCVCIFILLGDAVFLEGLVLLPQPSAVLLSLASLFHPSLPHSLPLSPLHFSPSQ